MPSSYNDALRSRLQTIDVLGEDQTTWERLQNNRRRAMAQQQQQLDWQRQQLDLARQRQTNIEGMQLTPRYGAGNDFEKFVNQIGQKESSGNYGALNRRSGALGKYQIMPSNIRGRGRGWDYEALGRDVSTQQFLASPEIQEKVARYKLQQYYNRYGAAGASIAWYAGPGAANSYAKTGRMSTNTQQWGFPSIASYVRNILGGL